MKRIIFWFTMIFSSVVTHLYGQLEATEWCPSGTWWTYKSQRNQLLYRYRDHEIYIYRKDTTDENRTVKKIDVYACESDMVLYSATVAFDSFISEPRYLGFVLMYRSNDSIFGKFNFITFVENYITEKNYRFLYKFNMKPSDRILYPRYVYDSFYCIINNVPKKVHPGFLTTDTLSFVSSNAVVESVNNKSVKLNYITTYSYYNFYGYKSIINNVAPEDYMINAPYRKYYIDTVDKLIKRLTTENNCEIKGGALGIYYNEVYDLKLWCYCQGDKGIFVDRHYGGYGSGCEYVKNKVIKSLASVSHPMDNRIKIFPNPVEKYFMIEGLDSDISYIRLYTSSGILVQNFESDRFNNRLDVNHIAEGTYVIHIYDKNLKLIHFERIQLKPQ